MRTSKGSAVAIVTSQLASECRRLGIMKKIRYCNGGGSVVAVLCFTTHKEHAWIESSRLERLKIEAPAQRCNFLEQAQAQGYMYIGT